VLVKDTLLVEVVDVAHEIHALVALLDLDSI